MFHGEEVSINSFSITIKFTSLLSGKTFHLTNIYVSSTPVEKATFIHWLYNFDSAGFDGWALVGDFNFIRSPQDRNKPGGSVNEMTVFNDLIQHLDLIEISFDGLHYTWSNM